MLIISTNTNSIKFCALLSVYNRSIRSKPLLTLHEGEKDREVAEIPNSTGTSRWVQPTDPRGGFEVRKGKKKTLKEGKREVHITQLEQENWELPLDTPQVFNSAN